MSTGLWAWRTILQQQIQRYIVGVDTAQSANVGEIPGGNTRFSSPPKARLVEYLREIVPATLSAH